MSPRSSMSRKATVSEHDKTITNRCYNYLLPPLQPNFPSVLVLIKFLCTSSVLSTSLGGPLAVRPIPRQRQCNRGPVYGEQFQLLDLLSFPFRRLLAGALICLLDSSGFAARLGGALNRAPRRTRQNFGRHLRHLANKSWR